MAQCSARSPVSRAWYHCTACGRGRAPRDAELGLAGDTMSLGLAKMTALAGAAEPFAEGSGLLADLAGVQVSARRIERHAEADGTAAAEVIAAQAAAAAVGQLISLPPAVLPDKLYIAIERCRCADGVRRARRAGRQIP